MKVARSHILNWLGVASVAVFASACTASSTNGGGDTDAGDTTGNDAAGPRNDANAPGNDANAPGNDAGVGSDSNVPGMDSAMAADAPMVCDPVKQTGCAAMQKCALNKTGALCAAAGAVATGAVCGTAMKDDCAAGGLCVTDMAGSPDTCHQFCAADTDCTEAAVAAGGTAEPGNVGHCIIKLGMSGYSVCTTPCNPVTGAGASGCPTGLACIYGATSTVAGLTDCLTPGTLAEGTACSAMTAGCGAGLTCVGTTATNGHCRAVCRTGTNADCVAGDTCVMSTGPMFSYCCPAAGC